MQKERVRDLTERASVLLQLVAEMEQEFTKERDNLLLVAQLDHLQDLEDGLRIAETGLLTAVSGLVGIQADFEPIW